MFGAISSRSQRLVLGIADAAGEDLLGDRAGEEARPEVPAAGGRVERPRNAAAQALGETGEIAESRREHALDAGADMAGEHRGDAFAGDGDGKRRAVDDRRRVEIAKLGPVDDVDRHAGLAGERPDFAVALLRPGGGEDQRRAGEIGGGRPGAAPVGMGGDQVGAGFLVEGGGEDDDLGPGLGEQPDLGRRLGAAADDDDAASGDLVEGREYGELA